MQDFSYYYQKFGEYGVVDQVNTPIIVAKGLPYIKPRELVILENGQKGWAFSLNRDTVDILLLSQDKIPVGTKIVRTDNTLSIPVGTHLLGMTINPLGQSLADDETVLPQNAEMRKLDIKPQGIGPRIRIKRPFHTGTTIVDMMIPIGKGQRELIIGDRKTGKSAFVLHAIKKQVQEGSMAVYCAIGKKKSDIKAIEELLESEGIKQKVVVVASGSFDTPSAIYLTPFTAMTIAEYFCDQGQDCLVVLDDLSTHANFYRELSLLAKNFPGRDSFPGDIFYTHARLLERAGNYKHAVKGEVSITCFPLALTIEADLTGYIQTNLMGITDGHIFFDNEIFYNGRRPAVNIGISVTRAGRQTQSSLNKTITREVMSFLSLHERMQNLSHFGSELTDNVKNILKLGDNIFAFFEQEHMSVYPEEVQVILFCLIWLGFVTKENDFKTIRFGLTQAFTKEENKLFFTDIMTANTLNELLQKVAKQKDFIFSLWKTDTKSPKN